MKLKMSIITILALILSACSAINVNTNTDTSANFGSFHTFNFAPIKPNPQAPFAFSQINQNRIKDAITHEMKMRNYQLAEKPDIKIGFYLSVKDETDVYGTGGGYWGYDYGPVQTYHYTAGTLIIDLVDTKNNKLIWQGLAKGILPQGSNYSEEKVQKVITKVFEHYNYLAGDSQPVATKVSKK